MNDGVEQTEEAVVPEVLPPEGEPAKDGEQ